MALACLLDFNSINVRLKLPRSNANRLLQLYFNSIKVRLKLRLLLLILMVKVDFNSIKVRLKLHRVSMLASVIRYFNSIKVRLKQKGATQYIPNNTTFQFHKGTIKTFAHLIASDIQ